jgi:hypothetical protein
LQLYVDKKQETKAFSLALEKESEAPHRNDITWYQALVKTVEVSLNLVVLMQQFILMILYRNAKAELKMVGNSTLSNCLCWRGWLSLVWTRK